MARNEQLIRQHKILQILERYRFGRLLNEIRDDLVDELGLGSLHTRSVRRDLEALQAAGLDVDVHDEQRGKVWKLGPRAKTAHNITASATELIALSLSRDLLYPLAGTPFWQGIESFWNKIKEELPSATLSHYEKYRQVLYVLGTPAKSYEQQHGILSTINRSIREHRIVEITYQSLGKPARDRQIEPFGIVYYKSSLYIVAAAHELPTHDKERIRHWKLDRFQKATALDEWYKPDDDFDLGEYISASMGIFSGENETCFKIKISSYAARWVLEDPWRPDQEVEKHDDGGITLTVRASHEMEIITRVLELGTEAEIVEPKSCREAIAKTIRGMAAKYV